MSSAAPGPPKLSPCCHSPALRHPAKCPVALPTAPCTLPVCPTASSAVAPRSPADSPLPVQSKGSDGEDKRGEGQPPRDYPKSLEPGRSEEVEAEGGRGVLGGSLLSIACFPADLPPGYSYPAAGMGFSEAHSAEPADPDTVHAGSPPAEPEQSRTFSPAGDVLREPGPPREPPASGAMAEGPGVLLHRHHLLLDPGPLCGERGPAPAAGATEEPFGLCREAAQGVPEQSPPEQQHPGPAVGGSPLPPAVEEEEEDEEEGNSDGSELEGSCDEEDGESSSGQRGYLGGLEALIAAGIDLGELPALGSPGEPPPAPPSPAPHASGIPGIALLSELADLELRRRRCDLALDGEQPPVPPSTPCFMASWSPSAPGTPCPPPRSWVPRCSQPRVLPAQGVSSRGSVLWITRLWAQFWHGAAGTLSAQGCGCAGAADAVPGVQPRAASRALLQRWLQAGAGIPSRPARLPQGIPGAPAGRAVLAARWRVPSAPVGA